MNIRFIWVRNNTKEGSLNKLASFINARGSNHSIYVFSSAIYYAFPVIFYTNSRFAQRFDQLWPILKFSNQTGRDKTLSEIQDKKYFVDMIAEDILKNKPDLIFVDNDHMHAGFDYVSFFSDNANFRAVWKSYHYLTRLSLGTMNNIDTNLLVFERNKN